MSFLIFVRYEKKTILKTINVSVCNIMAVGFRFMPLGLVRLRTFRLSALGYLGATLTQVFVRVRGADVSLRDVAIETRDGKRG